ncbi:hypothetical protein DFH09DRAFT_921720 [Mycena vulgaris]|nr:hypothetical protein DFH09DRAFT_921720 [Mycena vulgaris]
MTGCRVEVSCPERAYHHQFRYSGLGFRPVGYKHDLADYHAYVSRRSDFLLGPRGRAALLYGGIVGRLARSEVSVDEACRGPSDEAFTEGVCLWDGHSTYGYWDDCLTEQEIDLICGVYHVATGFGDQTSTVSWWPRPPAFDASGISVGWWTPLWEAWYQKRLNQLETGKAILCTHTEWKHNIHFERKAPPYTKAIERHAAQILETVLC